MMTLILVLGMLGCLIGYGVMLFSLCSDASVVIYQRRMEQLRKELDK